MKLPTIHIADQTAARIITVARKIRERRASMTEGPRPEDLIALFPGTGSTSADAGATPPAQPPAPDPTLPPLDQSGMDTSTVMKGGNSFDALAAGVRDQQQGGKP